MTYSSQKNSSSIYSVGLKYNTLQTIFFKVYVIKLNAKLT